MTTEEIYTALEDAFQKSAGTNAGCSTELSIRFWAVAAQIQALYDQCQWVRDQCFPQTATGVYLEHHATMRGLSRKEAAYAQGTLRFLVATPWEVDLTIPAGTVCMTAKQVAFATTESGILAAGTTSVDIPAQAVEPGASGNVYAGQVIAMAKAPVGITSCTNPLPFWGGADQESDEDLRQRVLLAYQKLSNGSNAAYYEQQAKSFDGVYGVSVVPRSRGIGTVDVFITSKDGLPSPKLVEDLQTYFDQEREICVDVQVSEPGCNYIALELTLAVEDGYDFETVSAQVEAALNSFSNGAQLGKGFKRSRVGALIFGVEGVSDYTITSPTSDIAPSPSSIVLIGRVTITEQEES